MSSYPLLVALEEKSRAVVFRAGIYRSCAAEQRRAVAIVALAFRVLSLTQRVQMFNCITQEEEEWTSNREGEFYCLVGSTRGIGFARADGLEAPNSSRHRE